MPEVRREQDQRSRTGADFVLGRQGRRGQDAGFGERQRAFTAAWGQTNRLLTGPFESAAAANAFIVQLRRADIDGAFVWTSPAGQVVDAIVAGK